MTMEATAEDTYQRGWERAFARQDAERAAERAVQARLEAAAERGAAKRRDARALLTVRSAAERLGVTDRTVRNLMSAGTLVTVRIPGTTARRIEPGAVDALIEQGREVRSEPS